MSAAPGAKGLIWALGVTQIIGYGTLYYSFAILAPAIARDVALLLDALFGLLSLALVCGGLAAPKAGGLADRFGAGRLMVPGSLAAGLALVAAAFAPDALTLFLSLVAMEVASAFVLYGTAFAAIVQATGQHAQRSITHLTLIAGFASTLFWPLTAALHARLSWQDVYLVFAVLNLAVCLPIHLWVARLPREIATSEAKGDAAPPSGPDGDGLRPAARSLFPLMLAALAIEGLVLAAILVHMVPLVTALGLGTSGLVVSTFFGPAQVASRLVNMLFGGRLAQRHLAIIAAGLLPLGLALLLSTAPQLAGVGAFAILFGLGSGLTSIVGGTLPLELYGRNGYGARLGWVSAARQFSAAFAPFAFAVALERWGAATALSTALAFGLAALGLFVLLARAAGAVRV
ncbi:arsenite efflux MFS transporter ArsK [Rhizobium sp. TRM95111]|uniref:arsenite efflux MFS transporter ArsK n=1 Tax=Rhizobium alarense TaxID=2846851 RepID=UPI001F254463|nr:arsenite efflux MFS transporter ArsK [Rhizobium alarense]MCF3641291.1 arsenite efflux MFS transporter ArsK [Rhizobium alarense]